MYHTWYRIRATPDFESVSVVSSFLLHDIPKHDTRLSDVREALLLGFRAYIGGYRKINTVLCLAAPRGDAAHHDH